VIKAVLAALLAGLLWAPQIVIRNANDCDNVPNPCAAVFAGSDTFASALNTTNWTILSREGDQSNSEVECYKTANQTVTGGELVLTIQTESVTCNGHAYNLTSSMVQWASYNFKYGTVEFRAKFPGGSGTWPAIWLLGANCQDSNPTTADDSGDCAWPSSGSDEIDIAEFPGNGRTTVNQQIHSGANNGGCTPSLTDASANYHTYQLVWSAGDLVWKIDGTQTCHVTTGVPSSFMFLIINVASQGNTASLPQSMNVDYVTITP
jgi:beta-glucanase (GH16 family)